MTASEIVARALASTPVVDGHNDLPAALREQAGYSVEGIDGRTPFHTDLPRLRAGGVGAQFWSVFVPSDSTEPEAVVATLEQIDAVYRLVARYPDHLQRAYTADDIERAFAAKKVASLLGVEGGHSLANSLGVLRSLARLGIRYVTLTHNDNNDWADSATDEPRANGLTDEGRAVVAELNRLGVLVDISHTSTATQRDAIAASTAPVIFSHSSSRALSDHPRNVEDEVLRLLPDNGGVQMLTFVPYFLSTEFNDWSKEERAVRTAVGMPTEPDWPAAARPGEVLTPPAAVPVHPDVAAWRAANPKPVVGIGVVADHIEHSRAVAGIEHIGLGGDYDGVDELPAGLEDVSGYPRLLTELAERGWSQSDLEALTGRNILRVLREAEWVASEPMWPGAR